MKNEKKKCRNCFGLLPKPCHDTMENCIVTWPYGSGPGIVLQHGAVGLLDERVTIHLIVL